MITYWLLLTIPILLGLSPISPDRYLSILQWFLYFIVLAFLIGFRHEVGGDWVHYMHSNTLYKTLGDVNFADIFTNKYINKDFGFILIHWISQNFFNGIYATNFFVAVIFSSGLIRLCRLTPVPWLAFVISIPYLVIVVSMGYTRQSAAIGFIMHALASIMQNNNNLKYYLYIFFAMTFHKTALIFFFLSVVKQSKAYLIVLLIFSPLFVYIFLDDIMQMVYFYYLEQTFHSKGGSIRVFMTFLSALLLLHVRYKWKYEFDDYKLWRNIAISSIILTPFVFVASTLIDRLSLYFIPLQIVVISRYAYLISDTNIKTLFVLCVVLAYSLVLYVWIYYGHYSVYWLPYDNIFFH